MLLCKHPYIDNNDHNYKVQSCNHQGPIYYFMSEKKKQYDFNIFIMALKFPIVETKVND